VSAGSARPAAESIAAAVLECPLVVRLGGGGVGEPATYLPGRRITGVAVRDETVEVSVVGTVGATAADLDDQVRRAVLPLVGERQLHVAFADIETPAESPPS